MRIIQCHSAELFSSNEFEDIDESALMLIVANDELPIREIDLFAAVTRWAVKECERKEMDSSDSTNLRKVSRRFNNSPGSSDHDH